MAVKAFLVVAVFVVVTVVAVVAVFMVDPFPAGLPFPLDHAVLFKQPVCSTAHSAWARRSCFPIASLVCAFSVVVVVTIVVAIHCGGHLSALSLLPFFVEEGLPVGLVRAAGELACRNRWRRRHGRS